MYTILVPVNYSSACLKALEIALTLADRLKARVLLCHIYQAPVLVNSEEEDDTEAEGFTMTEANSQQESLNKLRRFAKLVKEVSPVEVPVNFTVKAGSIVEELQKLVKAHEVTLVVMGTGKSSVLNTVFGSTTERFLKEATCPVLAVPEKAQANPFGRIVYASALEQNELNALILLSQARKLFNSTIAVLFVETDGPQEQFNLEERKNYLLKGFTEHEMIFSQLKSSNVAEGIELFVEKFNADMVALSVSHHSFWQNIFHSSVTSRLLHDLDLPLLAFPENAKLIDFNLTEEAEASA